jgi:hypothetical protein
MSLHIPKKYHEAIRPLIGKDLELTVAAEKDSLVITLTPAKTFRGAAVNHQKKSGLGTLE